MAPFERTFGAAGVFVSASVGVSTKISVPYGRLEGMMSKNENRLNFSQSCMLCTAEVDKAFPKARSVGNGLLHQNGHDSQKDRQKCKADPGKQEKKTLSTIGNTGVHLDKDNTSIPR